MGNISDLDDNAEYEPSVVLGICHSTRPCISNVIRGHIYNCVKRV